MFIKITSIVIFLAALILVTVLLFKESLILLENSDSAGFASMVILILVCICGFVLGCFKLCSNIIIWRAMRLQAKVEVDHILD